MRSQSGKNTAKPALLHPRNPHQGRYDLAALCASNPELTPYLKNSPKDQKTIDFSDGYAVLHLNKALLAHYYHVTNWQIPEGYLCPPIPGRADYIHCNKLAKRKAGKSGNPRNFGGQKNELWCADGEIGFLTRMVNESVEYSGQVNWFTSLVSKGSNIPPLKKLLSRLGAQKVDVLKMNQGQKTSRLLVWSFLTD